jgi:photosystem II stability/assembly factor-like uncharacterized protein
MKQFITCLFIFMITCDSFSQAVIISEQSSGTTQTLTSVSSNSHAFTGSYAWVCGYGGTVLRTTNNGVVWMNVSGNGIPAATQLINIASIDENTAVTAGYVGTNTFVYRSSNAGANWSQVFTETGGFIDAISFIDIIPNNTGFMIGDPVGGRWSLWKTSDGGITWDSSGMYLPQVGSEAGWNNSLSNDNGKLTFGTNNTRVYYSSDFGTSWTAQPTTGEINSYSIWYNTLFGLGFCGGGTLLKTTNLGTNWNSITSIGTGNINGISGGPKIITNSPAGFFKTFYIRSGNIIYSSSDNGASWVTEYTASSGNYRFISSNFLETNIWGVRDNGGITLIDIRPDGINTISNEVPDKFLLHQNYPNPFNPVTKIKFDIPSNIYTGKPNVKIIIYDVFGKEVQTLVNEALSPGSYETDFNGSNLSSGTYFYKLETGQLTETKRMMLIK